MIRNCSKCNIETEFPESHKSRQGYYCKPCRSKASVESAKKHRERKRRNNNAYSSKNSANRAFKTAAYRVNNPEKKNAHQAVQTAIRNGSLIKQPCVVCASTKRIHAHHDDYSQKLDVTWLCHTHHIERHAMLKAREASHD